MRRISALAIALLIAPTCAFAQDTPALKMQDPLKTAATQESTLEDQTDIAVTVYNMGRGLVRDRRKIKLLPGQSQLKFSGVAEAIQPETVSIVSLSHPGELTVLEQNYEYDLMSPQKLMEKYLGKQVRLISTDNDLNFIEKTAKLLANNDGPIYEIEGDIYLGHPGNVVLPEIPGELIARPSLIWLLDNKATDHEIEVSYLSNGLSWKADYVLQLAADAASFSVDAWVTLNNQSGATYNNAQLKLVAGDVNVVRPQAEAFDFMAKAAMAAPPRAAGGMEQEAFAEYHLYSLPRRTTIKQNQQKQVQMFAAEQVKSEKKYEFRGQQWYYSQQIGEMKDQHPDAVLVFKNDETSGMGMPLPAGTVRVYQSDSGGMLQFAGEDSIKHTPKNEEVRIKLGQVFDVVADRRQTDYQVLGSSLHASSFEIVLRNHKDSDIVVEVIEPIGGDWQITQESHKHTKRDAFTAVFAVPVSAGGEAKLSYTARVRY